MDSFSPLQPSSGSPPSVLPGENIWAHDQSRILFWLFFRARNNQAPRFFPGTSQKLVKYPICCSNPIFLPLSLWKFGRFILSSCCIRHQSVNQGSSALPSLIMAKRRVSHMESMWGCFIYWLHFLSSQYPADAATTAIICDLKCSVTRISPHLFSFFADRCASEVPRASRRPHIWGLSATWIEPLQPSIGCFYIV